MAGIYMSHSYNAKNSKDYLALGDPYDKKKKGDNSRYKSKQFQTAPPKKGQTAGFFGSFPYKPSAYKDNAGYLSREPRDKRKLGFGSFDASRRDEFTLDIRARQWKEKLAQEKIYTKTALAKAKQMKKSRPASAPVAIGNARANEERRRRTAYAEQYKDRPHLFQTQVPFDLYEVGRSAITPICNKCSRETFYCPHRVGRGTFTARRPGTATTAYQSYGAFGDHNEAVKPKYGNINTTKQFYDQSHLKPGW